MKQDADQMFLREAKAYLQPLTIADHLATRAFARGPGAGLDGQAALVFLAFAVEAFCNHVGWRLSEDFESFDRLPVRDKLRQVARLVDMPIDLGRRPFQTFHGLIEFRDEAAHARTQEVVRHSKVAWPNSEQPFVLPKDPPTEWVEFCTPEALERALVDVRKGLMNLYDASPLAEGSPFEKEVWKVELKRKLKPTMRPTTGCSPISDRADAV